MDEPLVCCICLTKDRPEYLKQAVECYQSQIYKNKHLVIVNSGKSIDTHALQFEGLTVLWGINLHHLTIGGLRNYAMQCDEFPVVPRRAEFIAHWDDDDWSSPYRLAEQVELLNKNNVKVTGYHDLPFYDVANDRVVMYESKMTGYAVGTSLMYRREVWERTPFPDQSVGEDASWQHAVKREQGHPVVSTSSLVDGRPMMVARMHAGNTCEKFGANYTSASPELDRAVRACLSLPIVAQ